ncbi:hypothetical protein EDC56_1772 [Sinobacterium caligoides]|uniref:Uncharacterized protein n=1 Tax=Sinobacterium caligoides TaxID=933926 RepID=A0A3N2DNF5_9GAMM|nr:hypothetical protein EDC56_1772 [Sinobacterium caligoides]
MAALGFKHGLCNHNDTFWLLSLLALSAALVHENVERTEVCIYSYFNYSGYHIYIWSRFFNRFFQWSYCIRGPKNSTNSWFFYWLNAWFFISYSIYKKTNLNMFFSTNQSPNKAKKHRSLGSLDSLALAPFVHGFAIFAQNSQSQFCRCWRR